MSLRRLFVLLSLIISAQTTFAHNGVSHDPPTSQETATPPATTTAPAAPAESVETAAARSAVNLELELLTTKLFIYSAAVQQNIGELVAPDATTIAIYNATHMVFVDAAPLIIAAGTAAWTFRSALREFQSVYDAVTATVRMLGNVVGYSLNGIKNTSEKIGINFVVRNVVTALDWTSTKIIMPVMRSSVNDAVLLSSAAGGSAGVAAAYSFLTFHDANSALTYTSIDKLFGHSSTVRQRLDQIVDELNTLFELNGDAGIKFRNALFQEILNQAIKNDFATDVTKYKIDVLKIAQSINAIPTEVALVANNSRYLYESITSNSNETSDIDLKTILSNVEKIAVLKAMLVTAVNSKRITNPILERQVLTVVGSIDAKLARLGYMVQ